MRILLNIGNTHTQIGSETPDGVKLLGVIATPRLLQAQTLPFVENLSAGWTAKAACVVPAVKQALQQRFGNIISFINTASYPQIDFSNYDVRTLGADRIANAVAAVQLARGRAVVVVDCGTCITTEAVDATGRFQGGAILPGRGLLRRGLHAFTAQLPEIPMAFDCPAPLGHNTVEAIAAGVDLGCLGALREILDKTRQQPGFENCLMIAVGGDAPYFLKFIPELIPGDPIFTLQGIALAQF